MLREVLLDVVVCMFEIIQDTFCIHRTIWLSLEQYKHKCYLHGW